MDGQSNLKPGEGKSESQIGANREKISCRAIVYPQAKNEEVTKTSKNPRMTNLNNKCKGWMFFLAGSACGPHA